MRCGLHVVIALSSLAILCGYYEGSPWQLLIGRSSTALTTQDEQQQQRGRRLGWWSDPKTVYVKNGAKSGEAFHSAAELRYVAFGTSKTWGSGLKDRDHETYIRLLSPTAVNMGLRATPANYPSYCLHSLIGDEMFDVIILEFSPYGGTAHDDFVRLTRRLRARFPNAIMIFLPIYMILYEVNYKGIDLNRHIRRVLTNPRNPTLFAEAIGNLSNDELQYPVPHSNAMELYYETMNSIGGYVIEFPTFQGDIKEFILWNAKYFGNDDSPWDFVHPNELGHQVIAEQIRQVVNEVAYHRPPVYHHVGEWLGGQDKCTSWYTDANITDDIMYIKGMTMVSLDSGLPWETGTKWALEVDKYGGSFVLKCHFPHCNIYLSYMVKGPAREYPRVILTINDKDPKLVETHVGNFHMRQLSFVGTADHSGLTSLKVHPVPEDVEAPLRFRITGVITTPTAY